MVGHHQTQTRRRLLHKNKDSTVCNRRSKKLAWTTIKSARVDVLCYLGGFTNPQAIDSDTLKSERRPLPLVAAIQTCCRD